jgi:hypothetical protein
VVAVRRFDVPGVEIGILDLDKVDKPAGVFERKKVKDLTEACAALDATEIRWFVKNKKKAWVESP